MKLKNFIPEQKTVSAKDAAKDLSEVDMPKMDVDSEISHDEETVHDEDDHSHDDEYSHHEHDGSDSTSSKRESCLKHIYPAIYDDEYERLRLLERVADLFRFCLGVRGSLRIGPTGFRTFARYYQIEIRVK